MGQMALFSKERVTSESVKAGRSMVSLDSQLRLGTAPAQAVWRRKQGRRRAQILKISETRFTGPSVPVYRSS